jgi:hypothetical protein
MNMDEAAEKVLEYTFFLPFTVAMATLDKLEPVHKGNPALIMAAIILMMPFIVLLFPVGISLAGAVMVGCVLSVPFVLLWRFIKMVKDHV